MKVCPLCRRYASGAFAACPQDGERLAAGPFPPLDPGSSVGGFTVRSAFAVGATGVLFRAERPGPLGGAPALLKLVSDGAACRRDQLAKASTVLVPGLQPIEAILNAQGKPCLVRTYVDGMSLAQRLALEGPVEQAEALGLAGRLAMAAGGAHAAGLVHGDIKPGHVLLPAAEGAPAAVLADVACPSPPGPFSAPERHLGAEPGEAADVYGVAATLYAALTGRPPFAAATPRELEWLVLNAPLVPASVLCEEGALCEQLDWLIAAALAKDPAARPSMERFAVAVEALRRAVPLDMEPPTTVDPRPPVAPPEPPAPRRTPPPVPPQAAAKTARAAASAGPSPTGLTNVFFRAGEALEQEVARMAIEEAAGRRENVLAWLRALLFLLLGAGLAAGVFWALLR